VEIIIGRGPPEKFLARPLLDEIRRLNPFWDSCSLWRAGVCTMRAGKSISAVERRHCVSACRGHCRTCASDQILRRIIPRSRSVDASLDLGGKIVLSRQFDSIVWGRV